MGRRRPTHATTDDLERHLRERTEDQVDRAGDRLLQEIRDLAETPRTHSFKRAHADRFRKGWKR